MSHTHIHDWSGFLPILRFTPTVFVPTYFVIASLAFIIGMLLLMKRAEQYNLSRKVAADSALLVMVSGFVGSRLFHVFFEEFGYYRESPMRVFEFWRGGFVWYGGLILSAVTVVGFFRLKQVNLGEWLDLYAPVCALGYAIGRVACLVTGCCFGEICHLAEHFIFRYPTQAFATIWELLLFAKLLRLERRSHKYANKLFLFGSGSLFFYWLTMHAVGRIIMEGFRGDPRGEDFFSLSIATVISIVILIFALTVLLRRGRRLRSQAI